MPTRNTRHHPKPEPRDMPPAQIAEFYGITFSPREIDLLTGGTASNPAWMRDHLDTQRVYILRMDLTPIGCPACGGIICRRSAYTGDPDPDSRTVWADEDYACPLCKARLIWWLALIGGGQGFDLSPGQTITVTRPERTPAP